MSKHYQNQGSSCTLIIAGLPGHAILHSGAEKACQSLNQVSDIHFPTLSVVHTDLVETNIIKVAEDIPHSKIVVAGINASSGFGVACNICTAINGTEAAIAIAEQSIGSPQTVFSAGQILTLIYNGATAVFREYDFIAEDTVPKLLVEHAGKTASGAILVGDPAVRMKAFLDEVMQEWNDPDIGPITRPELAFQLACTLGQVDSMDELLDTREKIASQLCNTVFPHNVEDTRKALGSLTRIWGLHTRTLSQLPQEAKKRGFPDPEAAEQLFEFIGRIEVEERIYLAASGHRFDILYISKL